MRVAAVPPLYPPDSLVGAWLTTHRWLRGLVAAGHDVDVVPFLSRPGRKYKLDGVSVYAHRYRDAVVQRADVVVSHLGDQGVGHRLAVDNRKPSVVLAHGGRYDVSRLSGVSLVVANSQATSRALSGVSCPVVVCYPPTFPELYQTEPGGSVTLVNLSAEKGGEVFWRLARALPDVSFLGVRGGYGAQVSGRAPNVRLLDPVVNMRDLVYAHTRVLLMPSRAESWGLTAVEAACSGIPTLAKPTPGLREALGVAGNFVDSYDTSMWASRLRELLSPDGWLEASGRALQRVGELDPQASVDRFVAAVEGVL